MKPVGIISRWNATCGVSLHAELIGREFLKYGIPLRVFAPYLESANRWWHHISTSPDEPFVVRCFAEKSPEGEEGFVEKDRILKEDLSALIVESWPSLPKKDVEDVVVAFKERGVPSLVVIHDSLRKFLDEYSDLNVFDSILIFHEGFMEILPEGTDSRKIKVLPYPYVPPINKRKRIFGGDGEVKFFSFGRQPEKEYEDYISVLEELSKRYPVSYKVIRCTNLLSHNYPWLIQEKRTLTLREIYRELQNADVHLIPKGNTSGKVVSSTLAQTLGSLIVHVAPDTSYFEDVKRNAKEMPIVLYTGEKDLEEKLVRIIEDPIFRRKLERAAKDYAKSNSVEVIARRILNMINLPFPEDFEKAVNL